MEKNERNEKIEKTEKTDIKIPKRILGTVLNAYAAGVVPRFGLEYVAIGRQDEINVFLSDFEAVASGMGSFRFIIGKYGSGKSFLLNLARSNALERGFVTADCDLSPERRFQGTKTQGLATFRELMKNLAVKASPDGGALAGILSAWLSKLQAKAAQAGYKSSDQGFYAFVEKEIFEVCSKLQGLVNGFDFSSVLRRYYEGCVLCERDGRLDEGEDLRQSALKWLTGEYGSKTEARSAGLGVSGFINDLNWYDFLKLYALFFRLIGYKGFFVFFDECVNLYKISNRVSREGNYEKILSMFNDVMQGKAEGIGIVMCGTPVFLEDPRRGLYSYEALRSRLCEGRFGADRKNAASPVIRLERLTDEELFALVTRIRRLHNAYYPGSPEITEQNAADFLTACLSAVGASEMLTAREVIRDFIGIMNVMTTDKSVTFDELLGKTQLSSEKAQKDEDDGFFDLDGIEI